MRVEQHTLAANQRTPFHIPGRFFLLIQAGGAIDVEFRRNKSLLREKATNVVAGYKTFPGDWADPDDNTFDEFVLTSATAQTVTVGVSASAGDYSFLLALVQIVQPNSLVVATDASVSTEQSLYNLDLNRAWALIQNNSASGFLRVGSTAVTITAGIRLGPGDSVVIDATAPINAIAESGTILVGRTSARRT